MRVTKEGKPVRADLEPPKCFEDIYRVVVNEHYNTPHCVPHKVDRPHVLDAHIHLLEIAHRRPI